MRRTVPVPAIAGAGTTLRRVRLGEPASELRLHCRFSPTLRALWSIPCDVSVTLRARLLFLPCATGRRLLAGSVSAFQSVALSLLSKSARYRFACFPRLACTAFENGGTSAALPRPLRPATAPSFRQPRPASRPQLLARDFFSKILRMFFKNPAWVGAAPALAYMWTSAARPVSAWPCSAGAGFFGLCVPAPLPHSATPSRPVRGRARIRRVFLCGFGSPCEPGTSL